MIIVKKKFNDYSWIFKALDNNNYYLVKKKQIGVNTHKKESNILKYCEDCKRVWEIGYTSSIHSYGHLPTLGLPRKKCKVCKGIETGLRGKSKRYKKDEG